MPFSEAIPVYYGWYDLLRSKILVWNIVSDR